VRRGRESTKYTKSTKEGAGGGGDGCSVFGVRCEVEVGVHEIHEKHERRRGAGARFSGEG